MAEGPDPSYAEVKERIQEFYAKYPDGRIVPSPGEVVVIEGDAEVWGQLVHEDEYRGRPRTRKQAKVVDTRTGIRKLFIRTRAAAYTSRDDQLAGLAKGTGEAWELFPGRTPYTKDSEGMNAETSAVGRALAMAGILVDRSVASAEEIRARREDSSPEPELPPRSERQPHQPDEPPSFANRRDTREQTGAPPPDGWKSWDEYNDLVAGLRARIRALKREAREDIGGYFHSKDLEWDDVPRDEYDAMFGLVLDHEADARAEAAKTEQTEPEAVPAS